MKLIQFCRIERHAVGGVPFQDSLFEVVQPHGVVAEPLDGGKKTLDILPFEEVCRADQIGAEEADSFLRRVFEDQMPFGIGENPAVFPGRKIAERIYERHTFFSYWLMELGVDRETALADACRIEHVLSAESFAAIKNHINKRKKSE